MDVSLFDFIVVVVCSFNFPFSQKRNNSDSQHESYRNENSSPLNVFSYRASTANWKCDTNYSHAAKKPKEINPARECGEI
jgi:hypothetical protein